MIAIQKLREFRRNFDLSTDMVVRFGLVTADIMRPELRRKHEKVFSRPVRGSCSRCSWTNGCDVCDPVKSLRYYLRKELTTPPEPDPQPKAKGRPKGKAKAKGKANAK